MRAGRAVRGASGLALALVLVVVRGAACAEGGSEVRVLSGPAATSVVTLEAVPGAAIEDRTAGAHPATAGQGPVSTGETFTGEITLFFGGYAASRSTAIDVGDVLVSTVRLFPEAGGTTVSIFVRQPVTYTVSRPSAIGEVKIELHARHVAATARAAQQRTHGGFGGLSRPLTSAQGEVAVDAESLSYDQQSNTLTARGGVTLTRGDATLTADEVVYDRTNEVAEARGHVVLHDPQATVEGDFAHLNLADETGWIETANADFESSNYALRAGRIEKEGGPRYAVTDGIFTTCECGGLEKPSWSILGHSTHVTLQGAGVVRGLTFRVKDVPVLWLPYFVFPANTQRQTGFLMPRVGYSNRRGFQYEQPFYWAINKSSDATVAVDVESAARVGAIAEYRYRLSRTSGGQFLGAYYNEQIRGRNEGVITPGTEPSDTPENRFLLAGHHIQTFGQQNRYYLDLFAVSDDLFLREINSLAVGANQDFALRSTRFTTSRTGFVRTWDRGLAWIEAAYFQDLIDPRKLAPQRLPRIEAQHAVPLLGDRLLGRISAEGVDYQREEGFDGLRGDIAPGLFLPFNLGRFVNGSLDGQLRETAYHLTDDEQVGVVALKNGVFPAEGFERFRPAGKLPRLDENHTRELAQVDGRVGTEISRIFDFPHLGLEKLRHTIEPEIQYLYVPAVDRFRFQRSLPPCQLPPDAPPNTPPPPANPQAGVNCDATVFSTGFLFDERDAINRRNFVSYGLSTRLLGRGPTAAESAARPQPAAQPEEEDELGESRLPVSPVDLDALASGIPTAAVPEPVGPPPPSFEQSPDFMGPPAPPGLLPPMKGPPPAPRELLRASILQGYDISRELVETSHLSDVDLGLRLSPVDYLAMSYNATVNPEHGDLRGQTVGFVVREPWFTPSRLARYQTASTIGIAYRFVQKDVNNVSGTMGPESQLLASNGLNEIDGSVYLRLGDYLGFTFIARYDLNSTPLSATDTLGPHFLERDYLFRLISRCNCWILEAGVADKTNPDERLFRVQFTLVGLGSFGEGPGRFARDYVNMPGMGGLRRMAGVTGGGYGY